MSRKPAFRWTKLVHDIAVLKDVVAVQPMNVETWDGVGDTLSVLFGATVSGRGCREHLDLLVKNSKQMNRKL